MKKLFLIALTVSLASCAQRARTPAPPPRSVFDAQVRARCDLYSSTNTGKAYVDHLLVTKSANFRIGNAYTMDLKFPEPYDAQLSLWVGLIAENNNFDNPTPYSQVIMVVHREYTSHLRDGRFSYSPGSTMTLGEAVRITDKLNIYYKCATTVIE